jgi:hypothetical protein
VLGPPCPRLMTLWPLGSSRYENDYTDENRDSGGLPASFHAIACVRLSDLDSGSRFVGSVTVTHPFTTIPSNEVVDC